MKGLDGVDWDKLWADCESKGDLKPWYIERFKALLHEHSDELPQINIHELHPYPDPMWDKYKCLGNYIGGMKSDLQGAVLDKIIIDTDLKRRINCFDKYHFTAFTGEFTTREEINTFNAILTDVINYLERQADASR